MDLHHTLAVGYIRGVVGDYASLDRQRERITALCAWQPPPLHCIIDEAADFVSPRPCIASLTRPLFLSAPHWPTGRAVPPYLPC